MREVVTVALTPKQKRFVDEYLVDLNATAAAKRAGYSERTARSIASENLAKPDIQAEIQKRRSALQDKLEISSERMLQEYARIAFFDPRRLFDDNGKPKDISTLDDDTAAALAGLDVLEEYEGSGQDREFVGYTKKYKVASKMEALRDLAKHLGLFDGQETDGEGVQIIDDL